MRRSVRSGRRSTGSGSRPLARWKPLIPHMIVLVAGLAITMPAIHAYSLLDEFYAMGALFLIYILAGLVLTLSFARSAGARGSKWLRRIAFGLSLSLVTLGIALLMNGGLDRFPANDVTATVLEKKMGGGRARRYHIFVSSLRPGIDREDLKVGSSVFERAAVGKIVTVRLHPGYLGLPWYADVFPEGDEMGRN